ncbi:NAD(P)/FAD-dependent oxidoreductase [Actinoplanes derwentensis]|uniref:Thioredoxin reductase n=1 Tax=Actinoplanes derwentensis TaxID=113562 RepID=A0A1H1Z7V7_9ACTN|nr:NAD(P)/FAD-dependent oxidoreductase [Actinoplanes derwentensis]GID81474.1 thioredoxin reductase [Actinoplanes derwentensis]SDT29657.1 Thioredoxin reductase [Actinoplanes derwentensis]
MNEYDVIVIGGGPAGLSAALILARALRRVAVIDDGAPHDPHPTGFPATARSEVTAYGAHLVPGTVTSVVPAFPVPASAVPSVPPMVRPGRAGDAASARDAGFLVRLRSGEVFFARRVLVATGPQAVIPEIPGFADRWGRDVLHCPYRQGFEVRDRPLGVLGGSPEAVQYALLIRQWSADIAYFAHTQSLTGTDRQRLTARSVRIVEGTVTGLVVVDDRLAGITLDRASVVAPHALFVAPGPAPAGHVGPGPAPADQLLTALGAAVTDTLTGRTSVPGVWAVVAAHAQMITAAGAGSIAAVDLHADLVEEDVRAALPFSAAQERQVAKSRATIH